ncbi:hypothetical protein [Sphingomonas sp.]|uniref:hypothetical protein n=1 Tax=Sphingomonas sp. TaxID=28214 RepID=UPI001B0C51A5|nr:hypothetical protein [Sphingomonas sp.]MBO9712030.1 hypothetical protein [Sphingomonas sp.]
MLAATAAGQQSRPPPPVAPPVPVRVDFEEVRRQVALEQRAALRKAARSQRIVTRSFSVGWEVHHGLFLVPANAANWLAADWLVPDFLAPGLGDRLAAAAASPGAAHAGQRLVCRCTGVEWSFHDQKRFLVREAELSWN